MTKEQRLEQIENRMWALEMADFLRGREQEEWEELRREKIKLLREIANEERG